MEDFPSSLVFPVVDKSFVLLRELNGCHGFHLLLQGLFPQTDWLMTQLVKTRLSSPRFLFCVQSEDSIQRQQLRDLSPH